MIGPRLQSLRVVLGEVPTADKWNRLLDLADEMIRVKPGPGVMKRSLPTATIIRSTRGRGGGSGGGGSFPFKATVGAGATDGTMQASFNLGYIAGVKPRIGPNATDLFIDDASLPVYTFKISDALDAATGIGMLYWEIKFNADFSILRVYPKAYKAAPAPADYLGWKLLGILRRDPQDPASVPVWSQQLFYNLGHVATQRHGGKALHRFWAQ